MPTTELEAESIASAPFDDLMGGEFVALLFAKAPTKVRTRITKALDHLTKAERLIGVDGEMGAIRLIAGQEELVVAIFEWIKLNEEHFPEHKDFVRKFKNHSVKLAFHPVLAQFRQLVGGILTEGFVFEGLEHIDWKLRPVIDEGFLRLAIVRADGVELHRHDPLHHDVSRGDDKGLAVVPHILNEFEQTISNERNQTIREYLVELSEYRNHILYATDGGYMVMGDSFGDLLSQFREVYRDLLWVLLALISGRPISKQFGVVSQFIGVYRGVLARAGITKADGTALIPSGGSAGTGIDGDTPSTP